ncbi:MAG: dihydroorotate dehydrogenase-like protein [Propioniciclava sp.]|uniref:dihydroorotate dehydrogenase-like protein n=1 Tax=Propioniciclava sp. TaxID=2038686 RepID=UPI0039E4A12C
MDLTTSYLGLELAHPIIASAGPLTQTVEGVKELVGGGASAVVLHSLFEEQLRAELARDEQLIAAHEDTFAEALDYFPSSPVTAKSAAYSYLSLVERAVASVDVPVIASLNGADLGGWVEFARELADAGASAIELNIYMVPGDVKTTGALVVKRHLEIVSAVTEAVTIPVSVKMSPYFSSVGNVALQLVDAGASGLVLFNRFLQPDVNIETLHTDAGFELSTPHEGRLPRTWIASLRNQTNASLAGSSGVDSSEDVVKYLLAGADVVMTTAALVRHGRGYTREMLGGLQAWMTRKGFVSLEQVRGMLAVPAMTDGEAAGRGGYVTAIQAAKARYGSL